MSEVNESTIDTNDGGEQPACSTSSSTTNATAVAQVPHADTPAEVVTTTQASHVPMAAATLIELSSSSKTSSLSVAPLIPTARIAEDEQLNSTIAVVSLHQQATSSLAVVGDEDTLPHAEATALHVDEEETPNPLESALPLSSLGETTIMHVEMDGELGAQESYHHDPSAAVTRSLHDDRQPFYHRWSKRRWVIIGILVGLILALIAVVAVNVDEENTSTSSSFIFAWSIDDEGLPPISSILLPVATKDEVQNLQDCYDHCDEVSEDLGVPYIALASFVDVFLPDDIFDDDDRAACICYRTAPCLEASKREGSVQAAIPAPNKQCSDDGNSPPPTGSPPPNSTKWISTGSWRR